MKSRTRFAAVAAVLAVPIGTFTAGSLMIPAEPQTTTSDRVVRLTAPDPANAVTQGIASPPRPIADPPGPVG